MQHLFQLVKYFFQKNLRSIISFSIILLISTVMFTAGLAVNLTISRDYDRKFTALNAANAVFTVPDVQYRDSLKDEILALNSVHAVEVVTGIMLNIPVTLNGSMQSQNQIFYRLDEGQTIGKYDFYQKTDETCVYPIYVAYYLAANSDLKLKDPFTFKVGEQTYTFQVQGIVEEMQYGNYSSSVLGAYLPEISYQYLREQQISHEVKTILVKAADGQEAFNEVAQCLTRHQLTILNKGYDAAKKQSRLAVSNILTLILLVFSMIILLISLLVTRFKIKQTLEEDLTNMGVLKSLGYPSKSIMWGIILPYLLTALFMTVIGMVLSIPVISLLGNIISGQAGFVWRPTLNPVACVVVLLLNLGLTLLFAYWSAVKIKKLQPIEALKGVSESNTQKNSFAVAQTKGNINFILALKNFRNNLSSNVLLGSVLFLMTLLTSFVVVLFYNVNVNPINFVNTLVEEHPTVMVQEQTSLKEEITNLTGVKQVIYYDENGEVALDDVAYKTFVAEDYRGVANDLVYQGRNPQQANEVAIGSAIQLKHHYKIGDQITLTKNGVSQDFTIVGFMQSVNNAGEVLEITLAGYQTLDSTYQPRCLYVYLQDESPDNVTQFIADLDAKYGSQIELTVNYVESMNSAASTFLSIVKLVTVVIIVVTLMIIFLILNILISGLITSKKQELGVLKALGYQTSNLIFQIVGGLMPMTILGVVLGTLFNQITMKGIFGFIFKLVGAYKVNFAYPFWTFVITSSFILLSTIIIGVILCRKIKKISVYALIKE